MMPEARECDHKQMNLGRLMGLRGDADLKVTGLTADSRQVRKGYLFAALPGVNADGRDFIPDALTRGAAAILTSGGPIEVPAGIAVLEDTNPRRRFAQLAAAYYGKQPPIMAAVTGTNGKTSVASFTRQIWQALGMPGGSVGTLGVEAEHYRKGGRLTSPDPVELHHNLAQLVDAGIRNCICEASSHGLAQYRLDGVKLTAAAFTNLSHDHLDYHGTMEAYFHAKARLFSELLMEDGAAVADVDSDAGMQMAAIIKGRGLALITLSSNGDADLSWSVQDARPDSQDLALVFKGRAYKIRLPLAGAFQASNALIAAALVIACGAEVQATFKALEKLAPVPGRLEKVGATANGAAVYVDYAHTPAGLETVLKALRAHTSGRLFVLFGCGGDRDRNKRPEMGRLARDLADHVIVTDDNPRSEDSSRIRKDILNACPGADEIAGRDKAIETAIHALQAGDVLVVAGKGHEEGQIVGEQVIPFSDPDQIKRILAKEVE